MREMPYLGERLAAVDEKGDWKSPRECRSQRDTAATRCVQYPMHVRMSEVDYASTQAVVEEGRTAESCFKIKDPRIKLNTPRSWDSFLVW
jgi:hypothetical protein